MSELKKRLEELLSRPLERPDQEVVAEEAAKALVELVKAEGRARRLLESHPSSRGAPREIGRLPLEGLPLHEAARRVLAEAGWPMHAKDLAVRIKTGGWTHPRSSNPRPDQMVFQLAARLPRYPATFRRVAPNTFALTEWGDNPPRRERPKPRIPLFTGSGKEPSAAQISEPPYEDMPFTDERKSWRSS